MYRGMGRGKKNKAQSGELIELLLKCLEKAGFVQSYITLL